ncbi:cellulase family glycosylhydrolase [Sphingomonas sp.]|uniref:glycoside hydrolase 5 family protein n=1 Tax=Sphingomonas sp. TaxID=28214 RepID=UPI001B018BC8|nr:cellulase family glycosylhydrolase [Sphingomonas sp.]MBO9713355.1 cellulase family glycosylhydrolase [Sphingomonas sp.]
MVTRRQAIGSGAALAAGLAALTALAAAPAKPGPFVKREGTRFTLDGKPYRFAGANMWYGAWLGAQADYGDRDRLKRELDALLALGVTNLRILAAAEEGPLKNSIRPGFRGPGNAWNPALLTGLDTCLDAMRERGMKAVLYLTNFWEWSGGMMTYLSYVDGGRYIDMGDPAHPWPEFPNATAKFYANAQAVGLYHDWVRAMVGRTNSLSGIAYRDDPAIMAWQLANEPRPGGDPTSAAPLLPAYYAWVRATAQLIRKTDPNHLVCTGSEGLKGSLESTDIYLAAHGFPEVDYCTAHVWPLNWGWVDSKNLAATNEAGLAKVHEYLVQHIALATRLGKPLVFEEFGYPRDGGGYDPVSSTHFKDAYYRLIYDAVETSLAAGGPVQGSNFWAWNGSARAVHGDHHYRNGDNAYMGDPPHEPQGWYGVFDSDETTKAVIAAHAKVLAADQS